MEIKKLEEVGVSFDDKNAFNLPGKLYAFAFRKALATLNLENQDIITSLERFFKELQYELEIDYDKEFLQLSKQNPESRSFIFYGAHTFGPEPLIYLASLPQILKENIKNSENGQDSLKLLGTDMFAKFAPEEIFKYIIPVVLRDSPGQKIICRKNFLNCRRQNRKIINDFAIESAANYILNGGESFVIFPQGLIKRRNVRWKTGIIRILERIVRTERNRAENIFLVPVYCTDIAMRKLFYRKAGSYFTGLKSCQIKVDYGKPFTVGELMSDIPSRESDSENMRKWMRRKAKKLQSDYELFNTDF